MWKIENAVFSDITTDYACAFYISKPVDLLVNSLRFFNLKTTTYFNYQGHQFGCSCFFFCGKNIYSDNIG